MANKELNTVDVTSIPAVAALEETKSRLRAFRLSNPAFFEYLEGILAEYNDNIAASEKEVRTREVSCGDFKLYTYMTRYDPEYMLVRFGREQFLAFGGKIEMIQKVTVDKRLVDVHIANGDIPLEDASKIKKKSPSYHAPSCVYLPSV